jgi:hypothetical protein
LNGNKTPWETAKLNVKRTPWEITILKAMYYVPHCRFGHVMYVPKPSTPIFSTNVLPNVHVVDEVNPLYVQFPILLN